jgi:hypothetical protein
MVTFAGLIVARQLILWACIIKSITKIKVEQTTFA